MRDRLTVSLFLEAIIACHLSSYVESPFPERGGLMIVGPPGTLKSAMVDVLSTYADALILSDVNAQSLGHFKNDVARGAIRTLVLPEMQKVYERAEHTSANVEGTLRALVAEGWSAASYEDQTIQRFKARATLIACMTPDTYEVHARRWQSTGFSRRFLWALITTDANQLDRAAMDDVPLDFGHHPAPITTTAIKNLTTRDERHALLPLVRYQPTPHAAQLHTLVKMLGAWKWWYGHIHRNRRVALTSLRTFALAMTKHGTELHLNGKG